MNWTEGEYTVSDELERLDLPLIHRHLSEDAYWSPGIPHAVVEKAFRNSHAFGVYHGAAQVGWARLVTDHATFAYLADVYVLPEHRGKGLSKWLMGCILAHPELQGLRRWMLATRDAHGLYAQFGFTPIPNPERFMQLHFPDVYKKAGASDPER